MILGQRFNLYFLAALGGLCVVCFCACKTPEKKSLSVVRLHLEVNRDKTERSKPVPIYRATPVMVNLETAPFITEGLIKDAKVLDDLGGFSLQLEFERRGAWLLEQYTTANIGKRIGVYSEFQDPPGSKTNTIRWLAAPVITRAVTNGTITFTPDATREESTSFVIGLNNMAKKVDDNFKW
jgi:preprotein translocase subunit SecD